MFTALISFLTVSLILGGVGYYFNGTVLRALQTPDNIMAQAELYLGIYFLGMPFFLLYNVLAAVLTRWEILKRRCIFWSFPLF